MFSQCARHPEGIRASIVISQDREFPQWRLQFLQNLSARSGAFRRLASIAAAELDHWHGDKITCEHDQIRVQTVDQFDRLPNRHNRKMIFVVEVAQLCDGEPVKPFGEAEEWDFESRDLQRVGLQESIRTGYGNADCSCRSRVP